MLARYEVAMTDEEMAQVPRGVVLVPMTAGSVAIAYNLPIEAPLKLSQEAYIDIFWGTLPAGIIPPSPLPTPMWPSSICPLFWYTVPMAVAPPQCSPSTSAEAYPIVTYSGLLLYQTDDDSNQAAALKDLVNWGLTEGQAFSQELGYVPLPEAVVEQAQAAVATVQAQP